MERSVHPGEFYRHFKDKLYQVVALATHSESGEEMVVYQALYGDYRIYVRPLTMFLEAVDREKYPLVKQHYRFERVMITGAEGERAPLENKEEPEVNPVLMHFLDAKSLEEKIHCLDRFEKEAGQKELDSIYVVLDMKPLSGTVMEQVEGVRRYLNMQKHYDGGHLR